ncbi:hypothetical protein LTSEHVI_5749, partial [Salmonella enterica subsp. enterica serovar Hvittingfoss str. A4-620]
ATGAYNGKIGLKGLHDIPPDYCNFTLAQPDKASGFCEV